MTRMQKFFWFVALVVFPASLLLAPMLGDWEYVIICALALYIVVGLHDLWFSKHTLNRLYPVAAYIRYALEYIRPEIHQYFIASDTDELPFNREERTLVYRRAKSLDDTHPFGTEHDLTAEGWHNAMHSIAATTVHDKHKRVTIGGADCSKPYNASRLNCSAMSFGALGSHAIIAINKAAKVGNFYHNTGEGGFSPYHQQGGDIVWQLGTAYFGCRTKDGYFDPVSFKETAANDQIKMIELKISQGAKPSHGGLLPGAKVTDEIARIRLVEPGKDVLSPPNHSAFRTPLELIDFIAELRQLCGGKPVGFKLCIGNMHEFMAIVKAMLQTNSYPDFITIDGAEGGTGAAPVEFSNRLGLTCLEGVNFVHNTLVGAGIRDKIVLIASGKTPTGFSIVEKLALGANIVNAARTIMLSLGCIQSQMCNTNRCPTGIATQNKKRSKALDVEARYMRVANYQKHTLDAAFSMIGAMGYDNPDDIHPHLIWQRDASGMNKRYDEMFPQLRQSELLHHQACIDYMRYWEIATADTFRSKAD